MARLLSQTNSNLFHVGSYIVFPYIVKWYTEQYVMYTFFHHSSEEKFNVYISAVMLEKIKEAA